MATVKLVNYSDASDSFTFPYNPSTFEASTEPFLDLRKLPYSFSFMGFSSPIKSQIALGMNGHFSGANKNSNYRSLVKQVNEPKLLKVYFQADNDKFYIAKGQTVQKVPSGNRPLHVDYVARFISPFGLLFDDTEQSGLKNSTDTNGGNVRTPFTKITGSVTSGQVITIQDASNNGFTFTASQSGTMTYELVKVVTEDNSIYITEFAYVEIDNGAGTIQQQVIKNASTSGDILLSLDAGESPNNIFAAGTVTNITPTFYWRDGWSSD